MEYSFYKKIIETTGTTYFLVKANLNLLAYFDFTLKNTSVH